MKNRIWLAGALSLALLAPQAAMAESELNTISRMDLSPSGITLQGSAAPTFTVFKLSDPERLVIDLAGSDVSAIRGPRDGKGLMAGVTVSQFSDENSSVGRVVIALQNGVTHDVRAEGDRLIVTLNDSAAAQAAAVPALPAAASASEQRQARSDTASDNNTAAAKADKSAFRAEAPAGMTAFKSSEPNAVAAFRDDAAVADQGRRIRDISFSSKAGRFQIRLKTDGAVGAYTLTELENPPRLALDLDGFQKGLRDQKAKQGAPISKVRFGKHDSHIRMVLDGAGASAMPRYDVQRLKDGLLISLKQPISEAPQNALAAAGTNAAVQTAQQQDAAQPIRDISYKGDDMGGRVLIAVGKGVTHSLEQPDARTAILTINGAKLPKQLSRSLDTSSYDGPVTMVSAFSAPGKEDTVQIVATLDDAVSGSVRIDRSGILVWELNRAGAADADSANDQELVVDGKAVSLASHAAAEDAQVPAVESSVTSVRTAAGAGSRKQRYTGQRISFEFKDIDIHNLLRIFADISKKNIIVGDNVSGKVTIKLRNVPWDQALDIVLKSKGLDKEEFGNIIRIAPAKLLEEEHKQAAEKAKLQVQLEPLKVRIIPINYATAAGLSDRVKDVLSERGKLSVDARTNVIIVKDVAEAIARAEGLVRRLDTQTPQVLIESRIVEANVNFSREFGIQWGGNLSFGPSNGNSTGLAFPNTIRVAGAAGNEGTDGLGTTTPNYAINLPAAIGMGAGGGVGFTFGSAGGAALLNLRLSAMESNGQSKTISAPRVITLDNNTATISQGISIPYSQTSASGVNTTFVEAKLELKVTPHVTADGSILLDINASNNQADASMTGANGQPAISKKEAQTQVLVKDGDTTVIGGIYTRSQAMNESGVPLFSRIPVLGWLFKSRSETDTRTELLIFITPRIVNRNQSLSGSKDASAGL